MKREQAGRKQGNVARDATYPDTRRIASNKDAGTYEASRGGAGSRERSEVGTQLQGG